MKYLFILLAVCVSCAFIQTKPGYHIKGTISGLPDKTWIYLRTATPDREIDSCQLMGGQFTMNGKITEKAVPVYLHTAKYTNYVHFWLENTSISMTLKAGAFKSGSITGSATQDENQSLDDLRKPYTLKEDSLNKLLDATKDSVIRKTVLVQLREADKLGKAIEKQWVKDHPNSLVAANVLNIYTSTWGKEASNLLYQNLSPEMKATIYGRQIKEFLALNKNIQIGDHFTDFEQLNTLDKAVKLSQVKGKYILLDFWASWCGPCREENPNLVKTYERFHHKGFAILGVSMDESKAQWLAAVKKDQLAWENVSDLRGDKNRATLIYGVNAIPNNFLIDENGVIIAKNLRGEELNEKLAKLLP